MAKLEVKDYIVIVAALLAAATSFANLMVNLFAALWAESRKSQRELLAPFVTELGETIHEVLATSKILMNRASNDESLGQWQERAKAAASKLKTLRRKAKYPLWGIDDALNVLGRLPDWLSHYRNREVQAKRLFAAAERLRLAIDKTVLVSLRRGMPPSWYRRTVVRFWVWRVRSIWKGTEPQIVDAE